MFLSSVRIACILVFVALVMGSSTLSPSARAGAPSRIAIDAGLAAKIDADVNADLHAAHGPGATIAVVDHGSIVYSRGYGLRDIAKALHADVRTRYEIGSITMQFTAAAILQLKEAGKIDIDAPLASYVPNISHAKDVTIRQLLTHTSGVPSYEYVPGIGKLFSTPVTFDRLIGGIAQKPLDFAPGSQWANSDTNYMILGRVIEVASHERWDDYVRQNLFARAGMLSSSTIAGEGRLGDVARGYSFENGRTVAVKPISETWVSAVAGIVSTVADLQRWGDALAAGSVISPSDFRLLTTSGRLSDGLNVGYGFGVFVDSFEGQPRIWHNGNTLGFDATSDYFPKQGVRIIVLANVLDADSDDIVSRIYNDLFPAIAAVAARAPATDFATAPHGASPNELYRNAVRTMRAIAPPAYLQFDAVTTTEVEHTPGQIVEEEFRVKTGDRSAARRNPADKSSRFARAKASVFPDMFLRSANAAGSKPQGLVSGLSSAGSPLPYRVKIVDVETLPNCASAVHLKLQPLAKPLSNDLRELWLDSATSRICRATVVWNVSFGGPREVATVALDLDRNGLLEGLNLNAPTSNVQQAVSFTKVEAVDRSLWNATNAR